MRVQSNNKRLDLVPGFSLLEVILVAVILAILAGFAMPGYRLARQQALNNEAQAMLRLIRAADRTYRLERGAYTACADTAACNTALVLDLPTEHWTFSVVTAGCHGGATFCGKADDGIAATDNWEIDIDTGTITTY